MKLVCFHNSTLILRNLVRRNVHSTRTPIR